MDSFYNGFASVCKAARTIFGRTGDMRRGTSHRKQKSITALCLALLLLASGTPVCSQQRVYFVDGYHGGIYGHYPVAWKTRFITDQLAAHPEWRIGLEIEPETWDTVEVRTPADYARFKAIAPTGASNSPIRPMPSPTATTSRAKASSGSSDTACGRSAAISPTWSSSPTPSRSRASPAACRRY